MNPKLHNAPLSMLFFWACPVGSGYPLLHLATLRRIRSYPSRKEKILILNTLYYAHNKARSQQYTRSLEANAAGKCERGRVSNPFFLLIIFQPVVPVTQIHSCRLLTERVGMRARAETFLLKNNFFVKKTKSCAIFVEKLFFLIKYINN